MQDSKTCILRGVRGRAPQRAYRQWIKAAFGGNLGRDAVDEYERGEGAGDPYAAPRRWNNPQKVAKDA